MTGLRHYAIVICAIGTLMPVAPATAQDVAATEKLYIVSTKPPSITVIDLRQLKVIGSIPLDPEPLEAVLDPTNRFLYVRHGPFEPRDKSTKGKTEQLTIVDVPAATVVERVRLGQNTNKLVLSPWQHGNLLFCFSRGHDVGNYWYIHNADKLNAEQRATVVVVDTSVSFLRSERHARFLLSPPGFTDVTVYMQQGH